MELIVIDETKLKIMLTPPDMRHYELSADRMSTASSATRRAFRHIFEDARARSGFDTEGKRILIQLYTSREGGCEIFVTKLGTDDMEGEAGNSERWSDGERALLARLWEGESGMNEAASPETAAYRFSDGEDLFALCRRLSREGYTGESAVYIEEAGGRTTWYLSLTLPSAASLPFCLSEYAVRMHDPDRLRLYLSEHGRVVCESGAVDILSNM